MTIAQSMTHLPSSLASGLLGAEDSGWMKMWFRDTQGTFASGVDGVFFYIFYVSAIFFAILMGLMVYFGFKYRRIKGQAAEPSASHNTMLELAWSVIPTILMAVMFYWGFKEYVVMRVPPGDAMEVYVTAKRWSWNLEYPNGAGSLETVSKSQEGRMLAGVDAPVFVLPVNKPIKFVMTSEDVIHSFYIPELRMKRDIFPNRYTTVWAEPTEITHRWDPELKHGVPVRESGKGLYLFCTEYCGDQHSQMLAEVQVMSDGDFRAWMAEQANTDSIPPNELGKILYKTGGCVACHSVDGSAGTGPTWQGIWDDPRPGWTPQPGDAAVEDNRPVVGLNYIRESIIDPGKYLREGYSNQMPTYQGKFKDREIRAIANYIKSLDPAFADEALAESEAEMTGQTGGEESGASGGE